MSSVETKDRKPLPRYASVLRAGLFAGEVHWVTGGGSGIGRCVAHELAALGATLTLPGLAGFVAEFHVFAGTFAVYPGLAVIGIFGILITAALFLQTLTQLFFGELPPRLDGFNDLGRREGWVLGVLAAAFVLIGVAPQFLLGVVEASAGWLLGLR